MSTSLRRELQYYIAHQEELVAKYNGQFIVLKGEAVEGVFDSELEALRYARKHHQPGSYMIQLVKPGKDSYTQTFHTRVSFTS